jgi:transposase
LRTPRERKPFPKDFERVETRIAPSGACTDCGGSFKELGTDVMEELEYVPGHYIVNQIIRPRLACTCCEAVVQAPMPSRPIPKSFVGPALMAHMVMMYLPAAAVSAGIDALGFRVWRLRVIDLFIGWWITKSRRRLGANVRKDRV